MRASTHATQKSTAVGSGTAVPLHLLLILPAALATTIRLSAAIRYRPVICDMVATPAQHTRRPVYSRPLLKCGTVGATAVSPADGDKVRGRQGNGRPSFHNS
ncbi:MAG: hypothetical protein HC804_01500 [Anaerolineae bacterium]|nr:hypothetical protein [Anaerolineae bacterium]